jgi:hypothetical protein
MAAAYVRSTVKAGIGQELWYARWVIYLTQERNILTRLSK